MTMVCKIMSTPSPFASSAAGYRSALIPNNHSPTKDCDHSPFFYPHLVPCPGSLLLPFSPDKTSDTYRGSSILDLTYIMNARRLLSCCTTSGSPPSPVVLSLPQSLIKTFQTPPGPVIASRPSHPSPMSHPLLTVSGASIALLVYTRHLP